MQKVCILTDSVAQFPQALGKWREFVRTLPPSLGVGTSRYRLPPDWHTKENTSPNLLCQPAAYQTGTETLSNFLSQLSSEFQRVFCILPSKILFPTFSTLSQIIEHSNFSASFDLVDSHSLGLGLGWLVQSCAIDLSQKQDFCRIKPLFHHKVSRLYTLLYLPNLSTLHRSELIDPDQAYIAELLEVRPLFLLEKDHLLPYQKIRNPKHLADVLAEYALEFSNIEYIGLHFGLSVENAEKKSLQNRLQSLFPQHRIEARSMTASLNRVLGDRGIGIILVEGDRT